MRLCESATPARSPVSASPGRAWRRRRWTLVISAGLLVCAVSTWLKHDLLLREAAEMWIISDPVSMADAAVVLGGNVDDRTEAAATYYREGLVKKILVSNPHEGRATELGAMPSNAAVDIAMLLKLGVPSSAIETFGDNLRNTHDEARALRAWAQTNGAKSFIVPTEIFSARRIRWMLKQALDDDSSVLVPALEVADYNRRDWWRSTAGVIAFQTELVKYIYYRIEY